MSSDERHGSDGVAALEAVGNETRVRIVKALLDYRREHPRDPGMSFSDLRERVGVRDSGRFNYHLDELRGRFVEGDDGTYTLTYAGRKLATAIISGTYRTGDSRGPVEYGECPGPGCASTLAATYEDGFLEVTCGNDHLAFRTGVPPAAVAERSMDGILDLVTRTVHRDLALTLEGTCHKCYGRMDTGIVEDTFDGEPVHLFEGICGRCGLFQRFSVGTCVLDHPEVVAFYHEHGVAVREQYPWRLDVLDPGSYVRVSEDPVRFRVDVVLEGDELRVTIDGTGTVLDTELVE